MKIVEYSAEANKTIPDYLSKNNLMLNACLGLSGEVGEVVDLVKKYFYQGHELKVNKVIEELGDVLWYINEMAIGCDTSLEEIAKLNIGKLRRRYGNQFSSEKSINRSDNDE